MAQDIVSRIVEALSKTPPDGARLTKQRECAPSDEPIDRLTPGLASLALLAEQLGDEYNNVCDAYVETPDSSDEECRAIAHVQRAGADGQAVKAVLIALVNQQVLTDPDNLDWYITNDFNIVRAQETTDGFQSLLKGMLVLRALR